MKKYSIILPVRNGGVYVRECINAILAQTLDDFNLIILDNCSTDGTTEWIASLNDGRIVCHRSAASLSIEENWGRIRDIQKNEFMTMIGHDDILDPCYLAVMDALIRRHPGASLYQTHFRYIDPKGSTIRLSKPMDERQTAPELTAFILCGLTDIMGTGFLMRSADYDRLGGLPLYPNLLFADFELWVELTRISYKATAPEECFCFRLHLSTTTVSPDIKYHKAFGRLIRYLGTLRLADPLMDNVIRRYGVQFIESYSKGLSHRLLRTPLDRRNGLTVKTFLAESAQYAQQLAPGNNYNPYRRFSLKLAGVIDRYWVSRKLFLLFKKLYPHPVYS
jgi:glycosyltransferase involved in cell wall biosynthesis